MASLDSVFSEASAMIRHVVGVTALGERAGDVPTPAPVDFVAGVVSSLLASERQPFHVRGVDLADKHFSRALVAVVLAPLLWNIIARVEFHTRAFSRVVGRRAGAYALAAWIFFFSIYRDLLVVAAMEAQPKLKVLGEPEYVAIGAIIYVFGGVLVVTSMYRLGVTGTYLGDYFGILMDAKVEDFPYSMFRDPMYDGASLCFFGKAILEESVPGMLLALWVYIVYQVALSFEVPFTEYIYGSTDSLNGSKKSR